MSAPGRTRGDRGNGGDAPRAWQRMLSGRRLDLLDPSPLDVEIEDIAHGLARVARWNGQTIGDWPYSVAQHSLLVEQLFRRTTGHNDPALCLAALLHDAAEYVVGDMISPFKSAIGYDYKEFEDRLMTAIHLRFGLPATMPPVIRKQIKRADGISAWFEATQLAGFSKAEARRYFTPPPAGLPAPDMAPQPTAAVKQAFLDRFAALDHLASGQTQTR